MIELAKLRVRGVMLLPFRLGMHRFAIVLASSRLQNEFVTWQFSASPSPTFLTVRAVTICKRRGLRDRRRSTALLVYICRAIPGDGSICISSSALPH